MTDRKRTHMRRLKTLEGIYDGRLYDINDVVAADTCGCNGCYTCCHQVGDLVEQIGRASCRERVYVLV